MKDALSIIGLSNVQQRKNRVPNIEMPDGQVPMHNGQEGWQNLFGHSLVL